MHPELSEAAALLSSYTCVLSRDGTVLTDTRRGIRPLLELLRSGRDLTGFSAADRVVGKAAAFLYVLMGFRSLYTPVISTPALEVLERFSIPVTYDRQVAAIQNRTGDGFCPMETAVWEIDDPIEARDTVILALENLSPEAPR